MLITVQRFIANIEATLSLVSINEKFICFGLEDQEQDEKVFAETRIPAGQYSVGLRTTGGFHKRYAKKFPTFHRGMLHILNVPDFEYILIHIGNTDADTAGCLLLGFGTLIRPKELSITHSRLAYKKLYLEVVNAAQKGSLEIVFINEG